MIAKRSRVTLDIDRTFWDHHSTIMELSVILSASKPQLYWPDYFRRIKCKERKTNSKGRRQTQFEKLKQRRKQQKIEKEIENEKEKVRREAARDENELRREEKRTRRKMMWRRDKLSNSTELSPSWQAAIQEFPSILWNPKVHYRVHKSPPPTGPYPQPHQSSPYLSILSKIHFNIIHSSTSWWRRDRRKQRGRKSTWRKRRKCDGIRSQKQTLFACLENQYSS
jgi:hypothetical protein